MLANSKSKKRLNKAFTLIEIISVIVLLAIIALITIPIFLNILAISRKNSAIDSAYGYTKALEQDIALSKLEKNDKYKDGYYDRKTLSLKNYTGSKPKNVCYLIQNGEIKFGYLKFDNYIIYHDGKKATISKESDFSCDPTTIFYGSERYGYVTNNLLLHYDAKNRDGYFSKDKNSTKIIDLSESNNDGIFQNNTLEEDSIVFNGTNSAVLLPIIKEPFITLETSFAIDAYPLIPEQLILSNVEKGGCAIHVIRGVIRGQCYINGSYQFIESDVHPIVGQIYSTSLSYDGSHLKLYIDGNLVATSSINGDISYDDKTIWALGANPSGSKVTSQFFKGKIYTSRIYNAALTDSDIMKNYQIDKSLYGKVDTKKEYLDYPESQGISHGLKMYFSGYNNTLNGHNLATTKWEDLTGNNNNGTIQNATWDKKALTFNGTSSAVLTNLFSYPQFTAQVNFSLSKLTTTTQTLFANYEKGGCGIHVTNGIVIGQCYLKDAYKQIKTAKAISPNKQYNAALSYDGAKLSLYLDGSLIGTISNTGGIIYPESTIWMLGVNPFNSTPKSDYLMGNIYSARLYDKALTINEIQKNMQVDKSLYSTP